MSIDFSIFDDKINLDEIQNEIKNTPENDFDEVPDGKYEVSIEKMEIKLTKAQDKLMFAVQCKILEGKQKGRMIFFNRIISGNKNTENWNDVRAIKSVITWLVKLETIILPEFINYGDFADCVLEIFQEIHGKISMDVEYKANAFNPITILEVFDL